MIPCTLYAFTDGPTHSGSDTRQVPPKRGRLLFELTRKVVFIQGIHGSIENPDTRARTGAYHRELTIITTVTLTIQGFHEKKKQLSKRYETLLQTTLQDYQVQSSALVGLQASLQEKEAQILSLRNEVQVSLSTMFVSLLSSVYRHRINKMLGSRNNSRTSSDA